MGASQSIDAFGACDVASKADFIAAILQERAGRYYGKLRGTNASVQLVEARVRPYSELYEFTISGAGVEQGVFVKLPHLDDSRIASACNRPRLFPPVLPKQMGMLEYRALTALDRHFSQPDSRFGAVRVLDLLPDLDALILEKAEGQVLRDRMRRTRVEDGDLNDELAFQRAGAWLREFHALSGLEHTRARSVDRIDFINSTQQFLAYLESTGAPRWLGQVGKRLAAAASQDLPRQLPMGLAHGDFAPRNILLSASNRVTVLDTLARWRAPIYEDLALFLLSLRLTSQWTTIGGRATTERWSSAFLQGYFGSEPIPWSAVRLFECQAILDRWCSYASRPLNWLRPADLKPACRSFAFRRLAKQVLLGEW